MVGYGGRDRRRRHGVLEHACDAGANDSAKLWKFPAATATKPAFGLGTLHSPWGLSPQANTEPPGAGT